MRKAVIREADGFVLGGAAADGANANGVVYKYAAFG